MLTAEIQCVIVSARCVMAPSVMSETLWVGKQMILETVHVILMILFLLEAVNSLKKQGEQCYRRDWIMLLWKKQQQARGHRNYSVFAYDVESLLGSLMHIGDVCVYVYIYTVRFINNFCNFSSVHDQDGFEMKKPDVTEVWTFSFLFNGFQNLFNHIGFTAISIQSIIFRG